MYLGVEAFWFNPDFKGPPRNTWYDKVRYLVSASTVRASLRQLRRAPWELEERWRRVAIARRCVIGRTDVSIAWRNDGSRLYGYELAPRLYHPSAGPFTTDLSKLDFGFYDGFSSLSARASTSSPRRSTSQSSAAGGSSGSRCRTPAVTSRSLRSRRSRRHSWRAFTR